MSQMCKEIMRVRGHIHLEVDKNNILWNTVGILRNYINTDGFWIGAQYVQYRWETSMICVFSSNWSF